MSHTLYYWTACRKFYGRAAPIKLTLDAAGAAYEIKQQDEAPKGPRFTVPIVTFPNGVTMSQTTAILEVIGEMYSLNGLNPEAKMLCKQYLLDLTDIFTETLADKLASDPTRAEKWYELLDSKLTHGFFLGDKPSIVDFYAIFVFEWLLKKAPEFDKFPKVAKWWKDIKEVPVVKKMYDSGIPVLPE
ncbi:hypothetical protein CTAYLR_004405 [Chrysophaeum taylorii]|uniref:GST C-terminal domain-containing protein n=1 Tax=Chrysophaeum taylorii TaxID=2483200 RepID=A0AAD7UP23_9STRA|nr:hypothetical protein CTAYLR_004405 [Chrysophaeum taylorii]